jgi:UDP-N-acetylmuramoylalanine--D-glutamate ligase
VKKNALVIGLGISGKAAVEYLLFLGYEVSGVDRKKQDLEGLEVAVFQEGELTSLKDYSLIILSPGIPSSHPLVQLAKKEGIEVIGEIQLALQSMKQKAIGITGTNGKTTVTYLIEHVLRSSGKKAKALGNVGDALSKYMIKADLDEIAVIELSSYQLEMIDAKVFDVGLILNITSDHLDRYSSMKEYAQAKIRLEHALKPSGILYVSKEVVDEYGSLFTFAPTQFGLDDDSIDLNFLKGYEQMNAQAAWLACSKFGVSEKQFLDAFKTFKKPPHRMEFVKEVSGVRYYDDSKGTNVDAVIKAVSSVQGPIILIAGGVDKGASYLPWKEAFEGKVSHMFLIGEAASKIQKELGLFFNVKIVDSLEYAVKAASEVAAPGAYVLLSPGCSSFDMFRDYKQRGKEFQRYVGFLEERGGLS